MVSLTGTSPNLPKKTGRETPQRRNIWRFFQFWTKCLPDFQLHRTLRSPRISIRTNSWLFQARRCHKQRTLCWRFKCLLRTRSSAHCSFGLTEPTHIARSLRSTFRSRLFRTRPIRSPFVYWAARRPWPTGMTGSASPSWVESGIVVSCGDLSNKFVSEERFLRPGKWFLSAESHFLSFAQKLKRGKQSTTDGTDEADNSGFKSVLLRQIRSIRGLSSPAR